MIAPATDVVLRPARAEDGERLRAVMHAAKAHWGYDNQLVSRWVDGEDFSSARFASHEIVVATSGGEVVGWSAVRNVGGGASILEDIWVDPASMGCGIGRRLFKHVADRARTSGAVALEWDADPKAVPFYERMGAAVVGETASTWERGIPVMRLELG